MGSDHEHDAHAALHRHAREAADRVLEALTTMGERVTAPRRAVIEVLAHQHDHLTAESVNAALPDVHRATVFRTLDRLAELGLVNTISVADATGYHLAVAPSGHEHLHARCRNCGRIVVLPVDALQGVVDRLRQTGVFELEPEHSELVGMCAECTSRG